MIFSKQNRILVLFAGVTLVSCDMIKMKEKREEQPVQRSTPVARALNNFLYPEDLEGIVGSGISKEDSTNLIERYITSWAKKQLLINEAASKIQFNEVELQRKILDYRYALMVYEFEKQYINKELNTEVTAQEIKDYYNKNQDKFELKQNIVRGLYIKVPNQAPTIELLKKLILSKKMDDKEELKSYCFRFATSYSLEDSTWINFDEIIKNTPLINVANKVQFLKDNKYVESSDDQFNYFIRIDEYKISDQISPLEFVEDQIKNIIINKRKVELANNLEEEVFNRALINNEFEIYKNK